MAAAARDVVINKLPDMPRSGNHRIHDQLTAGIPHHLGISLWEIVGRITQYGFWNSGIHSYRRSFSLFEL